MSHIEILVVAAIIAYIVYLRFYAGSHSKSEKSGVSEGSLHAGKPSDQEINSEKSARPLIDVRLLVNLVMVIVTSALVVAVIKNAQAVHLPYLVAVASAISIGFAEPHRGWLLALAQCILIACGYFLFAAAPENEGRREFEQFALYGSMILTLAASFLGAFLKRAMNMH